MKILTIIRSKYYLLISLGLILVVIYHIDWLSLGQALKNIKHVPLIIGIFLVIPTIFIKAWRWNYFKKIQHLKYKIMDSFAMYSVATALGLFTPGKIGEIAKIYYLKKDGHSLGKSLVGVIMDRIFDLAFLTIFSYLGFLFLFGNLFTSDYLLYLVIPVSVILLAVAIRGGWYKYLSKKIFQKIIPEEKQNKWSIHFNDFVLELKYYNKKNYIIGFLITALAWFIYYLQIYFFAGAASLENAPIHYLMAAITISAFINLFPISFIGIGTREAVLILLLSRFTASIEPIILLSELIVVNFILGGTFGAFMNLFKPFSFKKIN